MGTYAYRSTKPSRAVLSAARKPVAVSNAQEWDGYANRQLRNLKVSTFVSVPLMVHRRIIGALSIGSAEQRRVNRQFIKFLATLGTEVARLIDRKMFEEHLKISEERYRQLFHKMVDTVLIVDPATGKILDTNPQATELTGYTRAELIGRTVYSLASRGRASAGIGRPFANWRPRER